MVAFHAAITGDVPVAFDFPRMAWVAGFWFTRFSLRADDCVDLGLREFGDGAGWASRHVGGGGRGVRHGGLVWRCHVNYFVLNCIYGYESLKFSRMAPLILFQLVARLGCAQWR